MKTKCMARLDRDAIIGACNSHMVEIWHGYDSPAIACGRHADENLQAVFNGHRIQLETEI